MAGLLYYTCVAGFADLDLVYSLVDPNDGGEEPARVRHQVGEDELEPRCGGLGEDVQGLRHAAQLLQ